MYGSEVYTENTQEACVSISGAVWEKSYEWIPVRSLERVIIGNTLKGRWLPGQPRSGSWIVDANVPNRQWAATTDMNAMRDDYVAASEVRP